MCADSSRRLPHSYVGHEFNVLVLGVVWTLYATFACSTVVRLYTVITLCLTR